MRRRITALAVLAIAALVAVTAATARTDAEAGAGRYIVVLKPGANARAVANEHAAAHAAAISFVYSHALSGYAATIPNARLAAVEADERVDVRRARRRDERRRSDTAVGDRSRSAPTSARPGGQWHRSDHERERVHHRHRDRRGPHGPERRRPRQFRRRPEPRLPWSRDARGGHGGGEGQRDRRGRRRARRSAHGVKVLGCNGSGSTPA